MDNIPPCKCLQQSEDKIINFIKEKFKEDGKKVAEYNEEDSGYVNKVLTFSGGGGWKLVMPFELAYTPIKVNGQNGKEVKYKTNIFPTFCPFCGRKSN